jgi:hypothetical protein
MVYVGQFFHLTNQEEILEVDRRHGEFNLIVDAEDAESAVNMFKERIIALRQSRDFFQGDCSIFFVQLLEFKEFPKHQAMMLNFKSVAGDPLMPFIGCSLPSEETDWCSIYEWKDDKPEIDGQAKGSFIAFKD